MPPTHNRPTCYGFRRSAVENEYMWTWSWSEATYEHKAFQYWAPKSMLAVPLSTWRWVNTNDDGRYSHGHYEYVSKLMLVEVNESDGELKTYGEVNHSSLFDTDGESYWWGDHNIRRSIFMGDFVYAISSAGVTATNLSTMEESDSLTIPRSSPYDYYEDVAVAETDETGDGEEREQEDSSSSGEADDEDRADDGRRGRRHLLQFGRSLKPKRSCRPITILLEERRIQLIHAHDDRPCWVRSLGHRSPRHPDVAETARPS